MKWTERSNARQSGIMCGNPKFQAWLGVDGADTPDNLVACCKSCNSSKGARTPEEWRGA